MIGNVMIKKDTNSSPVRLLGSVASTSVAAALIAGALIAAPGVGLAAGAGVPAAETRAPPAQHKSQAKKKLPSNRSSLEDFITGYKAAYALIYEQGDYERAITALRALDHDDNADVANLIGYSSRKLGRYDDAKI